MERISTLIRKDTQLTFKMSKMLKNIDANSCNKARKTLIEFEVLNKMIIKLELPRFLQRFIIALEKQILFQENYSFYLGGKYKESDEFKGNSSTSTFTNDSIIQILSLIHI